MAKDSVAEEFVEIVEEADEQPVEQESPSSPNGTTKMIHSDGRVAYAHESMVDAYKSAGFREE